MINATYKFNLCSVNYKFDDKTVNIIYPFYWSFFKLKKKTYLHLPSQFDIPHFLGVPVHAPEYSLSLYAIDFLMVPLDIPVMVQSLKY